MLELGFIELAIIALWVYCIFDVIRTDESSIENLPKMIWLLIVILVPPIGPLAWLLLGRPRGAGFRLTPNAQSSTAHPSLPPPALPPARLPDEDFQRRREEALRRHESERQAEREAELRRREEALRLREEELRRREQGPGEGSA